MSRPSLLRPLSVLVAPLRIGPMDLPGDRTPAAVVFVSDPERTPEAVLARLYGLSAAESRVAALLLRGYDMTETADRLDLARNTTRTHLKRVFDKTGTRRQAELAALLLRGPARLLFE